VSLHCLLQYISHSFFGLIPQEVFLKIGKFLLSRFCSEEGIFKELQQMFLCYKASKATLPEFSYVLSALCSQAALTGLCCKTTEHVALEMVIFMMYMLSFCWQ